MNGDKTSHILGTSANLFGICAVLITGVRLTNISLTSYFDEALLLSAFLLLSSCFLSYLSIRGVRHADIFEQWADYTFLTGLAVLFVALLLLTMSIL